MYDFESDLQLPNTGFFPACRPAKDRYVEAYRGDGYAAVSGLMVMMMIGYCNCIYEYFFIDLLLVVLGE